MSTEGRTWFKSSYSGGEGGDCLEAAFTWRKSSYSDGSGGECVEIAYPWHKSSYSEGSGGDCVEIASCPHTVHIRDSKNPTGPQLALTATAWDHFLRLSAQEREEA
ncbi:DUF397 domain-containing protein [Streptomyces sp. NPDC048290]|uniref:DUF397 domain-containing protein n=1 Tax=Streptomyces sp. NPDC048290 TaxID=3155811 RepID=UPI00341F7714